MTIVPLKDEAAAVTHFENLFWLAHDDQLRCGARKVQQRSAYRKAMKYAVQARIARGTDFLRLSVEAADRRKANKVLFELANLKETGTPKVILAFLKERALRVLGRWEEALTEANNYLSFAGDHRRSDALHHVGLCLMGHGDLDQALEYFHAALDTNPAVWKGSIHISIGRVHYQRAVAAADYEQAISEFKKAKRLRDFPLKSRAWFEIGNTRFQLEEFKQAANAYDKALTAQGNHLNRGMILNGLGNACTRLGQLDYAITYYRRALRIQDLRRPARVKVNLADALRQNGCYKEACATVDEIDKHSREYPRAQAIKKLAIRQHAGGKILAVEESLVCAGQKLSWDTENPETRIRTKILDTVTEYDNYSKQPNSDRDNSFSVLRGWGSSIPLLHGADGIECRGGGYFLKWRGQGVVIDPGFDFVRNFHEAGFRSDEVHGILISHNHPDHNADLPALESLLFETRKGTSKKYVLGMDAETKDDPLYAEFRGEVRKWGQGNHRTSEWRPLLPDIEFRYFAVEHKTISSETAVGFSFKLLVDGRRKLTVAYTADTGYFDGLPQNIVSCDVLVAHIGSTRHEEFPPPKPHKVDHLGYNGLIKLINNLKPRLTIVGEFWGGIGDLRIDLIKGLRRQTGLDSIIPASVNLHLDLKTISVECNQCRAPIPAERLTIVAPAERFGSLGYLCSLCRI